MAEEGVCGRTTVFEDPLTEGLCGFAHLAPALYANSPLDLLVVMLGTNDCKQRYSATAQNIADGLARLVTRAKQLPVWAGEPKVLIVAPIMIDPRVHQVPRVGQEMGEGCVEKSRLLPGLMEQTARETGCEFMDCNPCVQPGEADWMHFDADSQARFALALEAKIRVLLGSRG